MHPGTVALVRRQFIYVFSHRLPWCAVALVVLTLLILFNVRQEVCVRWWGMLLQLIGVGAVVAELRGVQDKYGLGFQQWWRGVVDLWPRRDVSVVLAGVGAASAAGTLAAIGALPSLNSEAGNSARIAALEAHVEHIEADVKRIDEAATAAAKEAKERIAQEADARKQAVAAIADETKKTETASLPFSLFGAGCLLIGVILGTGSIELVKWTALIVR